MKRKSGGFTLVEILVVVAIIAMLTGLVVPAMFKIKRNAQTAACKELIKQVGLALDTYASDFQKYPEDPWKNWTDSGPGKANDKDMPEEYPSYLYFLINNPRQVYMNMKEASLYSKTKDPDAEGGGGGGEDGELLQKQKDVLVKDVWGKPMIYVRAPDRRDLGQFFRIFPNSGKYNMWSVGPDQKCSSCKWESELNTDTVSIKGDHDDDEAEIDPLGKTPHIGGRKGKGKGNYDDVGNWQ